MNYVLHSSLKRSLILWIVILCSLSLPGCIPSPVQYTDIFVREGAVNGIGTSEKPFGDIQEALKNATTLGIPAVSIRILSETYHGNVWVTQRLRIIGEMYYPTRFYGSIRNPDGYPLLIRNLLILEADDFGIQQVGGRLSMFDVIIRRTECASDHILAGTAIYLSGGVQAYLEDVILSVNDSGGLWIEGHETKVTVSGLGVISNKANTTRIDDWSNFELGWLAALTVTDRALLLANNLAVHMNEGIGVMVCEEAQAHMRNSNFMATKILQTPLGTFGGINLTIDSLAVVELRDFASLFAEGASIFLRHAYLTAEDGQIRENTIGIAIFDPPEDYNPADCIGDSVLFIDNTTRVGGSYLPIPSDPLTPSAGVPDSCRRVPWD